MLQLPTAERVALGWAAMLEEDGNTQTPRLSVLVPAFETAAETNSQTGLLCLF